MKRWTISRPGDKGKMFGYQATDITTGEDGVKGRAEHKTIESALVAIGEEESFDASTDVVVIDDEETERHLRNRQGGIDTFHAVDITMSPRQATDIENADSTPVPAITPNTQVTKTTDSTSSK
jgi:hypothetical protein